MKRRIRLVVNGTLDKCFAVALFITTLCYLYYLVIYVNSVTLQMALNLAVMTSTMVWHTCSAMFYSAMEKNRDRELNRTIGTLNHVREIVKLTEETNDHVKSGTDPVRKKAP